MDIQKDIFTISTEFRNDIIDYFKDKKGLNCLEVGTYKGYTTEILSELFDNVIGLELLDHHIKDCKKFKNVEIRKFDVYKDKWNFKNIDVSFIDCGHDYNLCKSDLDNSLKIRGIKYIIFDDYGVWKGVKQVVNEYIDNGILEKVKFMGLNKNIPDGMGNLINDNEGILCKVKIHNWKDWYEKGDKKITGEEAIHPTGNNKRNYFISGYVDSYNIINSLNFPYDKKILEYGCGNGRILKHLKSFDIYGVDIIEDWVKECKELNLNVELLENFNIKVDIVYSFTVFIHLKKNETRKALKYINEKLVIGGLAYIQVPIYESNRTGCSFIDINTFDEKTFKKFIEEEGFEIVELFTNKGNFEYNNFGKNHDKLQIIKKKI